MNKILILLLSLGLSTQLSYGMKITDEDYAKSFKASDKAMQTFEKALEDNANRMPDLMHNDAEDQLAKQFESFKGRGTKIAENTYSVDTPIEGLFKLCWRKEITIVTKTLIDGKILLTFQYKTQDYLKTTLLKTALGLTGLAGVGYYFYKNPTLVSNFKTKLSDGFNYFSNLKNNIFLNK